MTSNHRKYFPGAISTAALLLFALSALGACRHARIQLAPPTPEACKSDIANPVLCEAARANQAKQYASRKPTTKTLQHYFIWWGMYPKQKEYDAAKLCPGGIREIYEYSTWKDGLYAELTFGWLLRRTMKVTCW